MFTKKIIYHEKSPTFWMLDLVRKSRAFLVLVKCKNKKSNFF